MSVTSTSLSDMSRDRCIVLEGAGPVPELVWDIPSLQIGCNDVGVDTDLD